MRPSGLGLLLPYSRHRLLPTWSASLAVLLERQVCDRLVVSLKGSEKLRTVSYSGRLKLEVLMDVSAMADISMAAALLKQQQLLPMHAGHRFRFASHVVVIACCYSCF